VTQLDLLPTTPPPRKPAPATLEQRFEAFHAANPHVLAEMLRLAREKLDAGATRIGCKALWEQLRESIRVRKLGDYHLDNSLTALYARALIEAEPRLAGVIEIRRRKAK
jgi:hypothetical protein